MIKDLDPEIHRNMHLIAKEEVEVQHLREQLGDADKQLVKNRSDIERLNGDLKRGDSHFVYCGKRIYAKQVETDLARRFEQFKVKEATLTQADARCWPPASGAWKPAARSSRPCKPPRASWRSMSPIWTPGSKW